MNKNDKDFMDQLSNLDDFSVEEIAENYPALYRNTKKRILRKCLKKDGFSAEIESDGKEAITISGTERYKRRPWYRFAASAAAFVLAVGGITSVFMLNRNLNGNDISETEKTSVLSIHDSWSDNKSNKTTATSSDKDHIDDSFGGYWGTNDDATSQTSPTVIEPTGYAGEESEKQKSYLEGRYFIVIDNGKYNGFEFSLDGTIRTFTFDVPYGNFKRYTGEILGYELIENWFSYGTIGDEANWKTGTIIKPNDGTKFSVQFDDSVYTFSKDASIFECGGEEAEKQKSYLEGRYFIVIDNGKYDGFEFSLDGTIRTFTFDVPYGNFKRYTGEILGYELIENWFSYGTIGDEANWKTGTIIKPNDGTKFSVQFDDSVYTFSNDTSIFEVEISLSGTNWYEYELNGPTENFIEFGNDGFSGHYGIPPEDYTTTDAKLIYLTYTKNRNDIIFYIGSDIATGKLSSSDNDLRGQVMMTLVWADGHTEYLYSDDFPITALQN